MARARKSDLRVGMDVALATTASRADWQAPLVSGRDAVRSLPVDQIAPNVDQPRRLFPERAMRELRESIEQHGVLMPILVRPLAGPGGARYQIVAGERRWRAAGGLGLAAIPAVVRDDIDDRAAIELALVENLQRRSIDPMEEARALRALLELGHSQEDMARRLCKSPAHVSERLRLTLLPESIQELVLEGRLSSSAARNVARISDPARQQAVARDLADGRFTMRQVEAIMRELRVPPPLSGEVATESVAEEAPVLASEPALAEPGVAIDLAPLHASVAALLAAARALPVGLDAATQAAVRVALEPLAALLAEWQVAPDSTDASLYARRAPGAPPTSFESR